MDKKPLMKEVAKSIRKLLYESGCKIDVRVIRDIAIEIQTFNIPLRNNEVIKIMDRICTMYPITRDEKLPNNWSYKKDMVFFGIYY